MARLTKNWNPNPVAHYNAADRPPLRCGLFRNADQTRSVGIVAPSYGLEKVSYMLPVEGYRFFTLKRLPLHRFAREGTFWDNTPIVLDRSVDLIHTFNMLPVNGRRFVMTLELEIPRYLERPKPWQLELGYRLLASKRCGAVLALTELGCRLAKQKMERLGLPEVAAKISVFRGGVLPSERPAPSERPSRGPLRLLFVGGDGFRKGLLPLVEALKELRAGGLEVELTVISAIFGKTYVFGPLTPSADALRQELRESPWVRYYEAAPNMEIREQMRSHHLLGLPTFDEAAPWTPVEAGMEALPVIGTDIMSFPEIVEDGKTGRLIPMELNEDRRWRGIFLDGEEKRAALKRANGAIKQGIIRCLQEVATNRGLVAQWGLAARDKMMGLFHPEAAGRKLKAIYDRVI